MKRKYKLTYKDREEIVEVKLQHDLSFGITEGKKWLKEKHPEVVKIEYLKN